MTSLSIRRISSEQAPALAAHLGRLGADGVITQRLDHDNMVTSPDHAGPLLCVPMTGRPWARAWGAWTSSGELLAHSRLVATGPEQSAHRVAIAFGFEPAVDVLATGPLLGRAAVAWAREHAYLEWIDAQATSLEPLLLSILVTLGFAEVGRITDRFRVHSRSVDQLFLTLRVARARAIPSAEIRKELDRTLRFRTAS
jgi:hypothetical protein